jgi:prepilin-type N-terminal cleavage/methylation domain-containing protein
MGYTSRRSTARGFTFVELLVASMLLLLFVGLVYQFLVPMLDAQMKATARAELHAQTEFAINNLRKDIGLTGIAGCSVLNRIDQSGESFPFILATVPLEDIDNDGAQRWSSQIVCYIWDREEEKLIRMEWATGDQPPITPPLEPGQPIRLAASDLAALAGSARTGRSKILASGVRHFEVTSALGPLANSLTQPVEVKVRLERDVSGQTTPEVFETMRKIAALNGV